MRNNERSWFYLAYPNPSCNLSGMKRKNLENIRKHEIDFADVSAMFDGEMLIELDERFDYGEDR